MKSNLRHSQITSCCTQGPEGLTTLNCLRNPKRQWPDGDMSNSKSKEQKAESWQQVIHPVSGMLEMGCSISAPQEPSNTAPASHDDQDGNGLHTW
eukprot:1160661-Pelagomonas_calceolata.AAC.7